MSNYVVFQEVATGVAVSLSTKALDYPDYEQLSNNGFYVQVMEGKRLECEDKAEELNGILSCQSL